MPTLDDVLYKWISRATAKLDDFDLINIDRETSREEASRLT
jgi:hypothetical protein